LTGFNEPAAPMRHIAPLRIANRGGYDMADTGVTLPIRSEPRARERGVTTPFWRPFETLRREVDRIFEDFDRGGWHLPFRRSAFDLEPFWRRDGGSSAVAPAADVVERNDAYEIAIELPGMEEKDIEVSLSDGVLTICGERQGGKEEKTAEYCLRERHFGAFERSFSLPDGVDPSRIEARFAKGILTVALPKKPEARKAERRIEVKAG
jgi:HSP20 family protein